MGEQLFGAAQHLLCGDGLRGFRAHFLALSLEVFGLLQRVRPFLAATTLVFLALLEVGRPPKVIDVDLRAVCIEVENLVDGVAQQLDVVRNDHDAAGEGLDPVAQPDDRVVIEVVCGFVEEQHVRVGEQHAGEFDPSALTTGEGIEGLIEHPVFKPQRVCDLGRLGVGCPTAGVRKLLVELHVTFHGALLTSALGRRHLMFGLANARDDRINAAHGNNAIPGLHLRVTHVRILSEIADGAVGGDRSRMLGGASAISLACEEAHRRGLTGAVTADEADTHAFIDTEARVVDELAGADAQREILDVNHAPRVEGGVRVGESTRLQGGSVAHDHAGSRHNGWCI